MRVLEFEQQGGYPGLVVMEELPLTRGALVTSGFARNCSWHFYNIITACFARKVFCDKEREGDERRCSEFVALSSSF